MPTECRVGDGVEDVVDLLRPALALPPRRETTAAARQDGLE